MTDDIQKEAENAMDSDAEMASVEQEYPTIVVDDGGVHVPKWMWGFTGTFEMATPLIKGVFTTHESGLSDEYVLPGGIDTESAPSEAYNPELCPNLIRFEAGGQMGVYVPKAEREIRGGEE